MTRVLVIDDEAPILRALRINLTARKYEVSTAADGASGLEAMARDRPDVLILDLGQHPQQAASILAVGKSADVLPLVEQAKAFPLAEIELAEVFLAQAIECGAEQGSGVEQNLKGRAQPNQRLR